jgi:hypothetical protein
VTVINQGQRGTHAFERTEPRRGLLAWLRDLLSVVGKPVNDDWTVPEPVAPQPQLAPPARPALPPVPATQRPEAPLAYMPPPPQDVLRAVGLDVMDMLGRDVSSRQAFDRLQRHMAELQKRYREQENLERRSASNVTETQMDVALLVAADRRGEDDASLEERAERVRADMLARAKRASDPAPTGIGSFPPITDDMPDPRISTVPVDVNEGDVEPTVSPVHTDGHAPIPEPTVAFLGGPMPAVLPRRPQPRTDPEAGLAHEAHPGNPTAVLPVQGATQTAVLPAVEAERDA